MRGVLATRSGPRAVDDLLTGIEERLPEDVGIGEVYHRGLGSILKRNDNIGFAPQMQNTTPLHFDQNHATQAGFEHPMVNSCLIVALAGQSVAKAWPNVFTDPVASTLSATPPVHCRKPASLLRTSWNSISG